MRLLNFAAMGLIGSLASVAMAGAMPVGHCVSSLFVAAAVLLAVSFARRQHSRALARSAIVAIGVAVGAVACNSEPQDPGPPPILEGTVQTLGEDDEILFADGVGTLTETTTGSGAPKGSFAAYPFGLTRYDSAPETRKFANAPRDVGVGLDQMGARSYAPELGVWTSVDSLRLSHPERGQEGFARDNAYGYAALNPVVLTDPTGRDPISELFEKAAEFFGSEKGGAQNKGPLGSSEVMTVANAASASHLLQAVSYVSHSAQGVLDAAAEGATFGVYEGQNDDSPAYKTAHAVVSVAAIVVPILGEEVIGARAEAAVEARIGKEVAKDARVGAAAGRGSGRTGGQQRLRDLAEHPNTSSADRGWIKQEENSIARGKREIIRNPPGKELAHTRGREAAKGYDHLESPSNLQNPDLHRMQYKIDDYGRANKERP